MRNITILSIIIISALFGGCRSEEGPTPEALLAELSEQRRFASADQLADWIIQQDPSLMLVDVRPHEEYDAFSLPGAINVPVASLLSPDERAQLNCDKYFIVFYANGTVLSEKAWMLLRRTGCTNALVLKGGLNEWTATITNPQEPPATAGAEEWDLYNFRKAASLYFAGGAKSLEAEPYFEPVKEAVKAAPAGQKTVPLQQRPPAVEEEEEGC